MEHQITEIRKLTKSKVLVVIDDEDSLPLYFSELRRYKLRQGEMVSPDVLMKIRGELAKRALARSYHLLQNRDYLEGQLYRKLHEGGYPDDIIEAAFEKLRDEKFLDDERYIGNYLAFHGGEKNRKSVTQNLLRRGAPRAMVEAACEAYYDENPDTEKRLAAEALKKKIKLDTDLSDWKTEQKLKGFLYRKGFSSSAIEAAIDAMRG